MKKTKSLLLMTFAAGAVTLTACGSEAGENQRVANTPEVVLDFGSELSGAITVSTFDSMLTGPFVEEAARGFMALHPEVDITVESFSTPPNIVTAEGGMMVASSNNNPQERVDYINGISTELMSGRGADIFALDVLPFYQYAAQGQLVNLEALMSADPVFNPADYRTEIFDAIRQDEGVFMFPLDYSFDYMTYNSGLFDTALEAELLSTPITLSNLIEIGQEVPGVDEENTYILPMFANNLLVELFKADYTHYVDVENRTANFTDGQFENLLEQVKGYEASGYIRTRDDNGMQMPAPMSMEEREAALKLDSSVFDKRRSLGLLEEFYENKGMGIRFTSMGVKSEDDAILGLVANDAGEVAFELGHAFGINANSDENKQLIAWEFIKYLAEDAMQSSLRVRGVPTNIAVFEERTVMNIAGSITPPAGAMQRPEGAMPSGGAVKQQLKDDLPTFEMNVDDIEMDAEQQAAYDLYVSWIEQFTSELNYYAQTNTIIQDIIAAEVTDFLAGTKTASDVANTLQNRVGLYLNE